MEQPQEHKPKEERTPSQPAERPDSESATASQPQPAASQPAAPQTQTAVPQIVIITGMSGAGRTEALHALEDLGYYCIDNLPPTMLVSLAELAGLSGPSGRRLAVVCDARSLDFFDQMRDQLRRLAECNVSYQVLFLDADDGVLRKRYSSLRRRHPLAKDGMTVSDAIALERRQLRSIREIADVDVDTTSLRPRDLRSMIDREYATTTALQGMSVSVFSFGFKYGLPLDADVVIDVRFLPNPYYDPALRDLNGHDAPVRDFVLGRQETKAFLDAWYNLLDVVMPGYVAEGKRHLSIAVGCTGGQHRSVALAEATGERLLSAGYRVTVTHRDLSRHSSSESAV